jgi:hypothetical protein
MIFICFFIFNSAFSSKAESSSTVYYLLIFGEFFISLALWPNLKDEIIYEWLV